MFMLTILLSKSLYFLKKLVSLHHNNDTKIRNLAIRSNSTNQLKRDENENKRISS